MCLGGGGQWQFFSDDGLDAARGEVFAQRLVDGVQLLS